jgi:hypothetical protein
MALEVAQVAHDWVPPSWSFDNTRPWRRSRRKCAGNAHLGTSSWAQESLGLPHAVVRYQLSPRCRIRHVNSFKSPLHPGVLLATTSRFPSSESTFVRRLSWKSVLALQSGQDDVTGKPCFEMLKRRIERVPGGRPAGPKLEFRPKAFGGIQAGRHEPHHVGDESNLGRNGAAAARAPSALYQLSAAARSAVILGLTGSEPKTIAPNPEHGQVPSPRPRLAVQAMALERQDWSPLVYVADVAAGTAAFPRSILICCALNLSSILA